jgi:DNA-binding Lrp family transcriptional regulator
LGTIIRPRCGRRGRHADRGRLDAPFRASDDADTPPEVKAVAVRGYVLIETDVGKAKAVGAHIQEFNYPGAKILAVDTVTGPYDVIVQVEAEDLDALGNAITDAVQKVSGVQRTTTCLAVRLA